MTTLSSKKSPNTYETPLSHNRNVTSNATSLKENPHSNGYIKKTKTSLSQYTPHPTTPLKPSQNGGLNLEDQFKAACDAIQNLPKNGPFQPSNEMLLKFYGYFKQATSGPCKTSRPSMFKVVERAKWDAW